VNNAEAILRDLVARGVITLVDDESRMQSVQASLLEGELAGGVERFQNYGFTSVPLTGAEIAVVFVGADRSHPIVVAADDRRYRMAGLEPGEVAVYHRNGDFIHLKNDNSIAVSTKRLDIIAAAEVNIQAATINVTASAGINIMTPALNSTGVGGKVTSASIEGTMAVTSGDVTAEGVSLRSHTHSGVQPGGGSTGAPNG